MLHLFDRAYRRGDPKMMHVCILHSSFRPLITHDTYSTVRKHYSTSMEVLPACKSM